MVDFSNVSGTGFFGSGFWGRKIFWFSLPEKWRTVDSQNGGYLEKMMTAWGNFGETFLEQSLALRYQRDPYTVRTEQSGGEWFYVTEMIRWEDEDKGEVFRLIGERDFNNMPPGDENNPPTDSEEILSEWYPWFPYAPISKIGRWWRTVFDNTTYEVVNVRSRNYDPPELFKSDSSLANEVWLANPDFELQFNYTDNWSIVGEGDGSQKPLIDFNINNIRLKQNITSGPGLISGAMVQIRINCSSNPDGSAAAVVILYDISNGDGTGRLCPEDGSTGNIDEANVYGTVYYDAGRIEIDLSGVSKYSVVYENIEAKFNIRGYYMRFFQPPLIDYLAEDFGFENDRNDPEQVQRSAIANVTKFLGKKATSESYRIRGAISLFDVLPIPLFKICSEYLFVQYPDYAKYVINGINYVGVIPLFLRMDDISADQLLYDYNNGGTPVWVPIVDNTAIVDDPDRWDGMSIAQAFSVDVCQGMYAPVSEYNPALRGPVTVTNVVALSEAQLISLGLISGYAISLQMKRCQYDAFSFLEGKFSLSVYEYGITAPAWGDDDYIIDGVLSDWSIDVSGATTAEDVGTWIVAIGTEKAVTSPINIGDNIAVRYNPGLDVVDCCTCRTKSMVMDIKAKDEAYDFYTDIESVDNAINRLKLKLLDLVPIHARIIAWNVTRMERNIVYGVQNAAETEIMVDGALLDGATSVLLTVEYRGDLKTSAKGMDFEVEEDTVGVLWSVSSQYTGDDNAETWYTVVEDEELTMTDPVNGLNLKAMASPTSTYGDVRWSVKYLKQEY